MHRGFQSFFVEKVAKVRSSTADAPAPTFTHVNVRWQLTTWSTLSIDFLTSRRLLIQFQHQYWRRSLTSSDHLSPNCSIARCVKASFRLTSKRHLGLLSLITPVLRKRGLDATNASSYRPISNLSVLSKLLERLVARQLMEYLSLADFPPLQFGFRQGHSTETAVLRVLWHLHKGKSGHPFKDNVHGNSRV